MWDCILNFKKSGLDKPDHLTELFNYGKAGMIFGGRWRVPVLKKEVGDRFRWGAAPTLHNQKNIRASVMIGPCGWAIYKGTKYPEEVFKFLEYLVGRESQIKTAKLGWNIPVSKEIANSNYFMGDPKDIDRINKIFLDESKFVHPLPLNPYISYEKMQSLWKENIDLAVLDKTTVEKALQNATKSINGEIKKTLEKRKIPTIKKQPKQGGAKSDKD